MWSHFQYHSYLTLDMKLTRSDLDPNVAYQWPDDADDMSCTLTEYCTLHHRWTYLRHALRSVAKADSCEQF